MLICAISHKTSPGNGWPVWRNIWYFNSDLPVTRENAYMWAGEIIWFERSLGHSSVDWGTVTFHQPMDADSDEPAGAMIAGAQFDDMAPREFPNLLPYSIGFRLRGQKTVGRTASWVLRASLGEGDINRGQRNQVALRRPADLQAFLEYTFSLTAGNVFPHLVEIQGSGVWPILDSTPIEKIVVGGPIRLNAARRAMAKQLSNSETVYNQVIGMIDAYVTLWETAFNGWGLDPTFHYYPASLKEGVLGMIAIGAGIATIVTDYLKDCDPDTPDDQAPTGRYLLTRDRLNAIMLKLKFNAEQNMDSAIGVPAGSGPDGAMYYDGPQWVELFGYADQLAGAVAAAAAFDYLNSTLAGPQSTLRGGYLFDPEQGPSS